MILKKNKIENNKQNKNEENKNEYHGNCNDCNSISICECAHNNMCLCIYLKREHTLITTLTNKLDELGI